MPVVDSKWARSPSRGELSTRYSLPLGQLWKKLFTAAATSLTLDLKSTIDAEISGRISQFKYLLHKPKPVADSPANRKSAFPAIGRCILSVTSMNDELTLY